jgi:A118-like holin Hol118
MNFDLSVVTTNALVIVPIVIAIVQAIKLTGWIPDHFAPLVSIGVGVIIGFLGDHGKDQSLTVTILAGAVYGLMASGLYSGISTTMKAHSLQKQKREEAKRKAEERRREKEQV